MLDNAVIIKFEQQFDALLSVAKESYQRTIAVTPDVLFDTHQNVFIKSYLVGACSILEAFIQDLACEYISIVEHRVVIANLPHNMISWVNAKKDDKDLHFKPFMMNKSRRDIEEIVSANYYKTKKMFERIGVAIETSDVERYKDIVSSAVEKRNRVVHHNDNASDLSMLDIISLMQDFKAYSRCLFDAVLASPHITDLRSLNH